VLGGAILEVRHQRAIVEALEAGRVEDARALIQDRYELYIRDRAHLGRGEDG
jgi:DNA-binding GntR family transcriptional regulator